MIYIMPEVSPQYVNIAKRSRNWLRKTARRCLFKKKVQMVYECSVTLVRPNGLAYSGKSANCLVRHFEQIITLLS